MINSGVPIKWDRQDLRTVAGLASLPLLAGTAAAQTTMDQTTPQSNSFMHRIDAAHPLSDESAVDSIAQPKPEEVLAAAGLAEPMQAEQAQLQGHQLMLELTRRQRDIDRREAKFNAFLATLDRNARTQRIKQSQREEDLVAREQECNAKIATLTQREAELRNVDQFSQTEGDEAQLRRLKSDLEERRLRLQAEENNLRYRQQKLSTQREASMQLVRHLMRSVERRRESIESQAQQRPRAQYPVANPSDLNRLAADLQQQHELLLQEQQEVAAKQESLQKQQQQLHQDREEWSATRDRETRRFQDQKTAERTGLKQRQEILERRSDELAKRQTALDQMQANVTQAHREALELRLATEQLWSQLGEKIPPDELAETLGQLRAKLSEHYRASEEVLRGRRDELRGMAQKLEQQQRCLHEDRQQFEQWFEQRNSEIEFQAARLVAREQELEQQQARTDQLQEKWQEQRHEYEDEIRRLEAKLRCKNVAA